MSSHSSRSLTAYLPLIAILLLGLGLRLYRLDALPLRGDEGFSAQNWAGQPLLTTLQTTATIEPHPPLTYVVFRVWGVLFGTQHELILRLLPALGNLIGIAVLYALGRRLHSRSAGLLAAFLWAINPYQIWHAQDFRNYALWSTTSVMAVWLAVRVMQRRKTIDWTLYGAAMLFSSLIFYFDLLAMGAVGLFVLIVYRRERGFVARWLALNAAIAIIVAATFLVLQGSLIGSGAYVGTTAYANPVQLVTLFTPTITFGDTLPIIDLGESSVPLLAVLGIVFVIIFVSGLVVIAQERWPHTAQSHERRFSSFQSALFLGCLGIVPPVALCVAAIKFGIFTPRYVMLSAPTYILVSALLMLRAWRAKPLLMRALGVMLFVLWTALNLYTLNLYYHDPDPAYHKTRDWRALSAYLAENVTKQDVVIQTAVDAGFGYYYHLTDAPALDIGLPANFDQPVDEIERILEKRTAKHRSLWVVARTFSDWANYGVVENWVNSHLQLVRQTVIDELPVRQYMPWEVSPDELRNGLAPLATFGPYVDLTAAQIFTPPEPTGELTIWLYWTPKTLTPTPYKVFVHLIGDVNPATGSQLWTQSDYEPQQGRVHTDSWGLETTYRDVYTLTVRDLPPGEYQVVVGLYDPVANERVLTENGEDHIVIEAVHLE